MMIGVRRLWFRMGLLLVVTAAVGSVAFVFFSQDQNSASALISTLVTVATPAVGAAAWLWKQAQAARWPLEKAADALAEQLREQWEQAAAERDLIRPAPIQLRWRWSHQHVTDSPAEAVTGRFEPLPGMAPVTSEKLQTGVMDDLLYVYGGLRSGRLLVLGGRGAGKSSAGIRLLRDALEHRASLTAEDRAQGEDPVPVPVLVTPQGWNPNEEHFDTWLAALLERDYDLLRAPEYGKDAAKNLIDGGHLAVILDGLDEMPEALRSVALRDLDRQDDFRLVVLTRTEELVIAVSGDYYLRGAAALELRPIESSTAAEYLARCQRNPHPTPWKRLIDHVREHPTGALAQALDTPLTLSLVRDTYGREATVDELIEVESRLGSRDAIEEHLLGRVLKTAYTQDPPNPPPPYTTEQAKRWLGQAARRMNEEGTLDLAWWRIPHWVPAWPRVLVTVVVISATSAFLIGSLAWVATHMNHFATLQTGTQVAPETVFTKILGYAFMFGAGLLVTSQPREKYFPGVGQLRWSRADIYTILFLGVGVGCAFGTEVGIRAGFNHGVAIALVSSFVVGLGLVLGGGPPQQLGWLRWCRTDTPSNHLGLVAGLVVGIVAGLGYGLAYGLSFGREYGLRFGIVYGLIVGVGYMLVIVLGGRSSSHRNQLQLNRTDTPSTLLIGFVIATVTAGGYGIIYVLIVILSGRSPLQQSRLRWSRTTSPTTLLTGLFLGFLYGLVYGLVYWLTYGRELGPGLAHGLGIGLTMGLLLGFRQPPTEATSPLDPKSVWHRELQFGLVFGLLFGLVSGLTGGLVDSLVDGRGTGLVFGVTGGIVFGLGSGLVSSAVWAAALANAQLQRRDEAPARMLRFLDDARRRHILRAVGSTYQFRDTRLKDRLAESCKTEPEEVGRSVRL